MASSAPRNSPRPPAYQICVDDRASFSCHFNTLFSEGVLFVRPQTPLWLALQRLVAQIPGTPEIVSRQFISAEVLESWTLDGEGFFRKFLARYIVELPKSPTEVVLTLQVDRDMSQIFLESAELDRAGAEYHSMRSDISAHQRAGGAIDFSVTGEGIIGQIRTAAESIEFRRRQVMNFNHFDDSDPTLRLRVEGDRSERYRPGAYLWAGWSEVSGLGLDMLDRAREAESTRRLNEILSGRKSTMPTACNGCSNYYGKTHGGNALICAMHPHGAESDSCADFEGATSET
jgi:hypothetical protein